MPTDAEPTNAGHDPTPWEIRDYDINGNGNEYSIRERGYVKVYAANGEDVIQEFDVSLPEGKANSEFMIRAVNSHADLLAALKLAFEHVGSGHIADIKIIEAALGKAEPKEGGAV